MRYSLNDLAGDKKILIELSGHKIKVIITNADSLDIP